MRNTIAVILITLILNACQNQPKKHKKDELEDSINKVIHKVVNEVLNDESTSAKTWEIKNDNYAFTIEALEYIETDSIKKPVKLTNYAIVIKILENVLVVSSTDKVINGVSEIHPRNGEEIKNLPDDISFVAYYPEYDIILYQTEDGLDVSFNLSNGDETELTGNPECFFTSEDNQFRLNGYLGSNDCKTYFIEKKINGVFKRIIPLSDVFEKNNELQLCDIEYAMWANDNNNLYIKTSSLFVPSRAYRITFQNMETNEK